MLHGAGILTYIETPKKWPSDGAVNIPAPWGTHLGFVFHVFLLVKSHETQPPTARTIARCSTCRAGRVAPTASAEPRKAGVYQMVMSSDLPWKMVISEGFAMKNSDYVTIKNGDIPWKMVISWDFARKNGDFMGFYHEQWWFHRISQGKNVISWDFTMNNCDFIGFYKDKYDFIRFCNEKKWFHGILQLTNLISFDFTMNNCDFMGFYNENMWYHEKWWFPGILPWQMMIS